MPNYISKIKSSDNTVYNIKDAASRNILDAAKGSYSSIGDRMTAYANAAQDAINSLVYLQHPGD